MRDPLAFLWPYAEDPHPTFADTTLRMALGVGVERLIDSGWLVPAENADTAFFDEIRKLSTVAGACRKRLAGDGELVALLREGLGQAEAYLDGRDEQVDAIARGLERAEDREATARVAEKALAQLAAARAQTSAVARGKGLRRCGTTWVRAEKLAHKLLLRQLRRGAPGQPVTKGPTGSIDTYAGTGAQGVDPQPRSALASSFSNPVDVAIDGDGRLYVVDLNNTVVGLGGWDAVLLVK